MKILVINGPNLNMLGKRNKVIYGDKTLSELDATLKKEAQSLGIDIVSFQSNSEGKLIDFIQEHSSEADGVIINPGALTHYSFSLRDALADSGLPAIEVHLSNIYAREDWRAKSVISPIARGQITGLGWRGYLAALRTLVSELKGESRE
ncbi:MAG: type II 3-dehydroquinate dehydratase [Dehalococcoidia bacterium]|nr:MAG: type II 3-dehydroquinate dehydratase [Dehalococcoidia bacterium]